MSTEYVPTTDSDAPVSSHQSNHVNLRVTYLHAGNPRPPHNVGAIAVSTTIGELKSRLQTDLLEHPRPEEQRLIYQGRPLMDINATLKEALRLEEPTGPLPYTIHIIIQPRQAPSHFRPIHTPMAQPARTNASGSLPVDLSANMAPEQRRALDMAYAHMNELQRQFATEMPHNVRTTVHVQHINTPTNVPPRTLPTQTSVPNLQAMSMAQQQHQRLHVQAHMNALQHHMNAVQTHPVNPNLPNHANSATTNLVEARLPQIIPGAAPFRRPSSAPGVPRHRQTASTGARRPLAANPNQILAHPALPQFPLYNSPPIHYPVPAPTTIGQPTVWLASSRSGPQALLFAPGHGFFSTNSTPSQPNPTPTPTTQPSAPQPNDAAQPAAAPNVREGQVAIRPPPGGLPLPQRPQDRNRDNEFWALVIQRGWLFLRLYMFIFVLSESGTWRRYSLLLLAAIVCLLPRENPLNNALVVARRHIDNLIGPPHPQPRDRERHRARRQQQPGGAGSAQGANNQQTQNTQGIANTPRAHVRGRVNTTPEQTARRLVRQHEQQNPNVIRDAFYRVEQAVALFLASLIPGVGERHIAAREEARREEEREQAEQRAREAEEEKKRVEEQQKEQEQEQEQEKERQTAEAGERSKAASPPRNASVGEGMSTSAEAGSSSTAETGTASTSGHDRNGDGDGDVRTSFT